MYGQTAYSGHICPSPPSCGAENNIDSGKDRARKARGGDFRMGRLMKKIIVTVHGPYCIKSERHGKKRYGRGKSTKVSQKTG
jgi:hypothetical protein